MSRDIKDENCDLCGKSLAGQAVYAWHSKRICGHCFFAKTGLEAK